MSQMSCSSSFFLKFKCNLLVKRAFFSLNAVIEKEDLQQDRAKKGSLVTDWPTVKNVWQWDFAIRHTKKTRSLQDWKSVGLKKMLICCRPTVPPNQSQPNIVHLSFKQFQQHTACKKTEICIGCSTGHKLKIFPLKLWFTH
jgi:hypothetical protein